MWLFGVLGCLFFFSSISLASASVSDDIRYCGRLKNAHERLACYDAIGRTSQNARIRAPRNDISATSRTNPAVVAPLEVASIPERSMVAADLRVGWSGPYLGIQSGASALKGDLTDSLSSVLGQTNNFSGFVGIYGGWNFLFGNFLIGPEFDVNAHTGVDTTKVGGLPGYIDTNYRTRQDWSANVRARAGVFFAKDTLLFATGGVSITDLSLAGPACPSRCSSFEAEGIDVLGKRRVGWTVGGGVETALNSEIHMKLEYLFSDYGSLSSQGVLNINKATSSVQTNVARLGLSYNFGR